MFLVKLFIFLFVVTVIYNILAAAYVASMNPKDRSEYEVNRLLGKTPKWKLLLGFLTLIDLLGVVYIAAYLLFFR